MRMNKLLPSILHELHLPCRHKQTEVAFVNWSHTASIRQPCAYWYGGFQEAMLKSARHHISSSKILLCRMVCCSVRATWAASRGPAGSP